MRSERPAQRAPSDTERQHAAGLYGEVIVLPVRRVISPAPEPKTFASR